MFPKWYLMASEIGVVDWEKRERKVFDPSPSWLVVVVQ
jgi:hypothetical protein